MDLFELLILLIIFLAPALGRLFGKKQPQPTPSPQESAQRDEDAPLAEALRQIREALGEEEPAPADTPAPVSLRHDRPEPRAEPRFHESTAPPPVVSKPPTFVKKSGTKPIRATTPKSVDLTTPLEVQKSADSGSPMALAQLLRDPQRAREALILHEVLGPPRSRGHRR